MKFTLSWLSDHIASKATLDEILACMQKAGLEVEDVHDPREKLKDFTVCKVLEAEPHPDADKLRVCKVETVDGIKQIVCGAPNARAGMTAIYAPLGTYIPGLDFALDKKPRAIRGIESHGMMCSTKEIEAGEDHDGIADLDDSIPLGTPAAEALGLADPVIDFEVTPNRPDWLGVQGIARDLAAAGAGRFIPNDVKKVSGSFDCPVEIRLEAREACPMFAGALVKGVKNGPSPDWMQQRLKAVGIQPRSLLVDVTNFISLDRARPLHAYDAAKLQGAVSARLGKKGEKLVAIDGKTYDITEEMCVIADDSGAIGLGGVMGGESTAVSAETTDVFIESAWFDPLRTARTGRATGIHSDARYRFERGVEVRTRCRSAILRRWPEPRAGTDRGIWRRHRVEGECRGDDPGARRQGDFLSGRRRAPHRPDGEEYRHAPYPEGSGIRHRGRRRCLVPDAAEFPVRHGTVGRYRGRDRPHGRL